MLRLKLIPLFAAFLACAVLFAACAPDPDDEAGENYEIRSSRLENPLPEAGFRAQLSPINPPSEMKPGEQTVVLVTVRNTSGTNWPMSGRTDGAYTVQLRNRWLEPDGETVVNDIDGGKTLPHDVRPTEEVSLPLRIRAPKEPGEYILELDMVQEQVNFFRERGSEPARIKVAVRGDGTATTTATPAAKGSPTSAAQPTPTAPAR